MTTLELNQLFAQLAIAQKQTDEKLQLLTAQVDRTTAQIDRTTAQIDRTTAQVDRTSAEVSRTSAEVSRTTKGIDRVNKLMGSMGNNQGDITEEYFYNSLNAKPQIGDVKFDRVTPNLIVGKKGKEVEFDIVMTNGNSVALAEVKQKVHLNDLAQAHKKVLQYRQLCPEYKNFKIYAGVAGFSIPADVVKAAHEQGLFVLKRSGNVFTADAKGMQAF